MFPLAREKRGRRQGSTSKELTRELILYLGPLVPLLLVNETFSIVGLMILWVFPLARQEAGKHQQRINSGVNSFSLVPWFLFSW